VCLAGALLLVFFFVVARVDLAYPPEPHAAHDDYPLAPVKLGITEGMISPHSKAVLEANEKRFQPVEKLCATLDGREGYVVHHRALRTYLKLGMRIIGVHRVLVFTERVWLEPYVSHNFQQRSRAANAFHTNFYKLLNNSIFGKTMDNVRLYRDMRIVSSGAQLAKYAKKPNYMAVLDISKSIMYDFHYGVLKPLFGQRMRLLFTDTDSLAIEVTLPGMGPDAYDMLQDVAEWLDTSSFPPWHPLFSAANKKVPGKFKDELCAGGKLGVMQEFVGLRAKCYAMSVGFLDEGYDRAGAVRETKRLKGIKSAVVQRQLRLDDYRQMIVDVGAAEADSTAVQVVLRSRLHAINTEQQTKRALSSYDDKRYVLSCGVHTLAYGNGMIESGGLSDGCPFCADAFVDPQDSSRDPALPR